jgi:hypothetical protein
MGILMAFGRSLYYSVVRYGTLEHVTRENKPQNTIYKQAIENSSRICDTTETQQYQRVWPRWRPISSGSVYGVANGVTCEQSLSSLLGSKNTQILSIISIFHYSIDTNISSLLLTSSDNHSILNAPEGLTTNRTTSTHTKRTI